VEATSISLTGCPLDTIAGDFPAFTAKRLATARQVFNLLIRLDNLL